MSAIPLWWDLVLAAALFSIGLYGTLTRDVEASVEPVSPASGDG